MMRILAVGLRLLAAIFQLFPVRRRVALLSRQSQTPSADFRLLAARLREDDPTLSVKISTTASELSGKLQFALHMFEHLWLARTSRVVVLDGYNPTVCIPAKRKGIFVIQLWHAAGAIKKFGFQCLDTPAGRSSKQAEVACMHKNYDLIVAAGQGAVASYAEAFGYPPEAVRALGLPHLSQLQGRMDDQAAIEGLRTAHPWLSNGNLNVVYAPTLRRDADASWLTEAVTQLARALEAAPVNLIVSKHPLTTIDEQVFTQHRHVHVLSNHTTAGLLPIADVLISDYSAIALEAGLAGVPALFYMPDVAQYRVSPGLNIDPVANPLLFGTESADDIAAALVDNARLASIAADYRSFIHSYFAGTDPSDSIADLVSLIEEHLG